jgi:V/A-type H+-transporting ATPase subunit G/H
LKEVIESILEEEKKARELVEAARQEAKQLRLKTDEETKALITQAQSEAQLKAKKMLSETRENAEKEKVDSLKKAVESSMSVWEEKSEQIRLAVDRIFTMITKRSKLGK